VKASASDKVGYLKENDYFAAPEIHYNESRSYTDLLNIPFKNKGWESYVIAIMLEKIKFDMDETGVTVENDATIVSVGAMRQPTPALPRRFVFDSPYWIIINEKGKRPFFVTKVNNV